MDESHAGALFLLFESHRDIRLESKRVGRHPSMLEPVGPLDSREPSVVSNVLERPVKEPVDLGIQEKPVGDIPRIARNLRIEPRVEDFVGCSSNDSFNFELDALYRVAHLSFSFVVFLSLKYRANSSRRSFQNRSYPWTHCATSLSGLPRNEI